MRRFAAQQVGGFCSAARLGGFLLSLLLPAIPAEKQLLSHPRPTQPKAPP